MASRPAAESTALGAHGEFLIESQEAASCPNCGAALRKVPKRRTRCPVCSKAIVVRSSGGRLFNRSLLTEREALVLDTFQHLELLGVTPRMYQQRLEATNGSPSRPADVLWGLWNEAVLAQPEVATSNYFPMARFVSAEGRNPRHLLEAKHRSELSGWKRYCEKTGIPGAVEVLSSGNGCSACEALNGARFALEDALKTMPLPVANCTHTIDAGTAHAFCRCIYLFHLDP